MTKKPATYQELSHELDDILARMQSADMDIDEAIKLYERGTTIAAQLETQLKQAENTVQTIRAKAE